MSYHDLKNQGRTPDILEPGWTLLLVTIGLGIVIVVSAEAIGLYTMGAWIVHWFATYFSQSK